MDKTKKLLSRISKKDLHFIIAALELLHKKEVSGIKIKGKNLYRLRVGKYRIFYQKQNAKNIITEVKRRDENTYK